MNSVTVPSSAYKRYLSMLSKIQELTTVLHIPDAAKGDRRESHVFYCLTLQRNILNVEGYVISITNNEAGNLTLVKPEEDFLVYGNFWAGSPQHVFRDYDLVKDKKNGKLSWAAAYDREAMYDTFYVDRNEPIVKMQFATELLERIATEVTPTKLGMTPVIGSALAQGAATAEKPALTNTLSDGPQDQPPSGANPTVG